jgi:hypothetical protein
MEHEEAIRYVVQHLLGSAQDQAHLRSASAHIANCQNCLAQLDAALSLLRDQPAGLAAQAGELVTCEECRALLPEYAELEATQAPSRSPLVARHLTTCADCREQLALLREWMALSLPDPVSRAVTPLWQTVEAGYRRIAAVIPIMLKRGAARFGQLAATLQFMQFEAVPVRGSIVQSVAGLHLDDPSNHVRIELRLASQTQLAIRLNFTGASTGTEPGRVIVARQSNGHPQLLQRMPLQAGDEAKLPLQSGQLLIRIEFGGQSWEIPLNVSEEG